MSQRQLLSGLLFLIAMLTFVASGASAQPRSMQDTIAFVDVSVIPMTGPSVLQNQTVVISDGVITAVGDMKSVRPPRGARLVPGRGRFLMPGLSDMHAHFLGYASLDAGAADRQARLEFLSYLATGVTTVRIMAGSQHDLDYRRKIALSEMIGPTLFVATPMLEGLNKIAPSSPSVIEPAQAEPLVAGFARAGYDYIKVYHTLSAPAYEAIIASAKVHGLRVIGHVPFDIGIERALALGQYSVEHLRGYDFDGVRRDALEKEGGRSAERFGSWLLMSDARMTELAQMTAAAGVWNSPTLVISRFLADPEARAAVVNDPKFRLLHPMRRAAVASAPIDAIVSPSAKAALRASLPRQRAFVKALHDAGAALLVGTDSAVPYLVPGFTTIDEIEQFVNAGLSRYQALRVATLCSAESLGIEAEMGTVSPGKWANLILLAGNPLADIQNLWKLDGVVTNGQWIERTELIAEIASLVESLEAPPTGNPVSPARGGR